MADKWIAECIPCGWRKHHEVQDDAIADVEEHIADYHHGVPAVVRAQKKIGHVQFRTVSLGDWSEPEQPVPHPPIVRAKPAADIIPDSDAQNHGSTLAALAQHFESVKHE